MPFSIFRIVQASPLSILKHFHHPKRVFLPPLTLFFQLHQNPSPRQPLILDISYKQNQTKCSNFNLFPSSSINSSRFIHAILCIYTTVFKLPNNILLYGHIFCLSVEFCLSSLSVDVNLGCFHFGGYHKQCYEHLCINFCVNVFSVLLDIYLRAEMLNHMVTQHFTHFYVK